LAVAIMDDQNKMSAAKIDAAMSLETESSVALKRKIPVYIAYFTAWADNERIIHFYEDIYKCDHQLAQMLHSKKQRGSTHKKSRLKTIQTAFFYELDVFLYHFNFFHALVHHFKSTLNIII
jgi:hypothetical protein